MKRIFLQVLLYIYFGNTSPSTAQWQLQSETVLGNQFGAIVSPGIPIKSPYKDKFYFLAGEGGVYGNFTVFDASINSVTYADNYLNTHAADFDTLSGNLFMLLNNTEISIVDLNTYQVINKYERDYIPNYVVKNLFYIEEKQYLIVHYISNDESIFLVKSMPDFETITSFEISGVSDPKNYTFYEDGLTFYFFPKNSNLGKSYNLESLQFSNNYPIPNYIFPNVFLDKERNRILINDYDGHFGELTIFDTNNQTFEIRNIDLHYTDALVDNKYDKFIVTSYSAGIFVLNMDTFDKEFNIEPSISKNNAYYSPFCSYPNNNLYVREGQHVIIFDLQTFSLKGKIKLGASLNSIIVDDNMNQLFVNEIDNGDFTSLTDYNLNSNPVVAFKETFDKYVNNHENNHFIDVENSLIYLAGGTNYLRVYNYQNNSLQTINTIQFIASVVKDGSTNKIFAGTNDYYNPNKIIQLNENHQIVNLINTYNNMNMDLEFDNNGALYSLIHNVQPGYTLGKKVFKINTVNNTIVDSLKFGYNLSTMKYSSSKNALYVLNGYTDEFPAKLYKIDCAEFQVVDSINIEGFATTAMYLNNTLNEIFILNTAQGSSGTHKLTVIDEQSFSKKHEQFLDDVIMPSSINYNEKTNSLYISDVRRGALLKYRNSEYPSLPIPTKPNQPEVLNGDTKIELTWDISSNDFNKFNIYRKTVESNWVKLNNLPIEDGKYNDYNLLNNTRYYYAITQLNEFYIESERSNPVEAIPIDLPDFTVTLLDFNNIFLNTGGEGYFNYSINRDNSFNEAVTINFLNIPVGLSFTNNFNSNNNQQSNFSVQISSNGSLDSGLYQVIMQLESNSQMHQFPLQVKVIENVEITFEVLNEQIFLGDIINIKGNVSQEVSSLKILIENLNGETEFEDIIEPNSNYSFDYGFQLFSSDSFYVYFKTTDDLFESDRKLIFIDRAKTNISCQTTIGDSIGNGWIVDVMGKIVPNPGESIIDIQLVSPDSIIHDFSGIPVNEFGYYGHSIEINSSGLWELKAHFNGNENFESSVSNPLFIPVGIEYGKVVLFNSEENENESSNIYSNLSNFAYQSLLERQIKKDDIVYLNSNLDLDVDENGITDDIDFINTSANLKSAILNHNQNTLDENMQFLVYLSVSAFSNSFNSFGNEKIEIDSLSAWLSLLMQKELFENIILIVESNYGNSFVDKISNNGIKVITSSNDSTNIITDTGDLSFSFPFWTNIRNGFSLGESFSKTYDIFNSFGSLLNNQIPLINFNNNSLSNEQEDFDKARELFVGFSSNIDNFPPNIVGSSIGLPTDNKMISVPKNYNFEKVQLLQNDFYLSVIIDDPENNMNKVYAFLQNNNNQFIRKELFESEINGLYQIKVSSLYNIGFNNYLLSAKDKYGMTADYKYLQMVVSDSIMNIKKIEIPTQFKLEQNFPNPFNPITYIKFDLPEISVVKLEVFNILGERVAVLINKEMNSGFHKIQFNGNSLSSGIYLYRIITNNFVDVKKMILLK